MILSSAPLSVVAQPTETADSPAVELHLLGPNDDALKEWRSRFAPGILGSDAALLEIFSIISRVCDTDCSVLIVGESGTGKELVARALHSASNRRTQPFIAINCAAIPENLLESELFGHARGAFTGATNSRIGKIPSANGGTLMLDEISELSLAMQAKLLRVLQDKEVTPVGDNRSLHVDVRLVAATNCDLEAMVREKKFREDLLYRIQVIPVTLPPLRCRKSDIAELVAAFIKRVNGVRNRNVSGLSPDALSVLSEFRWPGNIRQLENVIERVVLLRGSGSIEVGDLPMEIRRAPDISEPLLGEPTLPADGIDLKDAVERFENALIIQALRRTGWNKNRASSVLRMNRTTLVEKLKKKNLEGRTL
jgi:transcriptional regulator with PAS, ATPase and Fis domain